MYHCYCYDGEEQPNYYLLHICLWNTSGSDPVYYIHTLMSKKGHCINFANNSCRYGANCKFIHEQQSKKEEEHHQVDDRVTYLQQLAMQFEKRCVGCSFMKLLPVLNCGCEVFCLDCVKDKKQCPSEHEITGFIK